MDNLDRMYRHLVRTVRSRFPQYLTQPFDVAELYQTVLPYRHHRRELGLETNDDYEITLTELLAGARDYLIVDDQMRAALKQELTAANPDPSAFKQFARSRVALSPTALRSLDAGPAVDPASPDVALPFAPSVSMTSPSEPAAVTAPVQRVEAPEVQVPRAATQPTMGATPMTPPAVANPGRPSGMVVGPGGGTIVPAAGERCRACDGELPEGRAITFCPHCGQNLTTINCPACGSELELGWSFCPTCGRPADQKR
jgi:Double zinc ribbon